MLGRHKGLHPACQEISIGVKQIHCHKITVRIHFRQFQCKYVTGRQPVHGYLHPLLIVGGEVTASDGQDDAPLESPHGLVGHIHRKRPFFQEETHGDRGVKPPGSVVQRLVPAEIVHAGPGSHRPAVVELPVNGAHAVAPQTAEMLHAVADGVRLQQLGGVDQILKAAGIEVVVGKVAKDISVAAPALLVILHDTGEAVPVFLLRESLYGLHRGEALKAIFRAEAEFLLPVGGKGNAAVPDLPVVGIAAGEIPRIVEAAAGGRRTGPIVGIRRVFCGCLRQNVLVELQIVHPHKLGILGAAEDHILHFVVAAQKPQGGMVLKPQKILLRLFPELRLHFLRQPDVGAGDHEVLPDENAFLVAQIVEMILRVVSAAPHPQSIEIGIHSPVGQLVQPLRGHPAEKAVHGNVICAHGKDLHAVDDEAELAAPLICVRLRADCQGAQANPEVLCVQQVFPGNKLQRQVVQILLTVAPHPPESGLFHPDNGFPIVEKDTLPVQGSENRAAAPIPRLCLDPDVHNAVVVILGNENISQPIRIIAPQLHRAEDAHVLQCGAPVPAGLIVGRPQMGSARNGISVVHVQIMPVLLPGKIPQGRTEIQPQGVFPRMQQRANLIDIGSVHIFHGVQGFPVQGDLAQGIQAVKYQLRIIPAKERFIRRKLRRKGAVLPAELLHGLLVQAKEGIRYLPMVIQHTVHGAGSLTGQGLIPRIRKKPI